MSAEERIRDYVRGRADVSVPDDLIWPAVASGHRRPWANRSAGFGGRLAVAGLIVAVVAVGLSSGLATPSGPAHPSALAADGSPRPTGQASDGTFPAQVAGLPVISVGRADEQLLSRKLDGQVVAVGGYFDQFTPSCPYPGRYIGPLEGWCRFVAFTDTRATAQLCHPEGSNRMGCTEAAGTNLAPFFMSETSGSPMSWLPGGPTGEPAALVLLGHAGDARQWQCTAATQAQCANAFVVDRIAWAEGHDISPAASQAGDLQTGTPITPRMTLAQVRTAIGLGEDLLTGGAFRAGDIATIDPRWNLAGDTVVWLVRSLAPAAGSGAKETRAAVVWLVDDTTGRVIDSHPLQLDEAYQPARLWPSATVHGVECCAGNMLPFVRVVSGDGTVVYEGLVSGSASGGSDGTTFGGGYGSSPLILPAGDYSIRVWLAPFDRGVMGPPSDECSLTVTLRPLDNEALNADYPPNKACTFQLAPSPSPGR